MACCVLQLDTCQHLHLSSSLMAIIESGEKRVDVQISRSRRQAASFRIGSSSSSELCYRSLDDGDDDKDVDRVR